MKQRLTTGWTVRRVLYLIMGIFLIAFAISEKQWFAIAFGAYFASMGLFAFGCAGGNCYGGSCSTEVERKKEKSVF
ncbi:MAG: hypothetical protein ABI378_10295 [Chitinophagaceae bacterium]